MSVRFKGRKVGFDSAMPVAIARRHESPKFGDTQGAIHRSKGKALDFNMVVVWIHGPKGKRLARPVSGHWGRLGKDGYTHTTQGKQRGLRRLTKAEKKLSYQQWIDRHGGTMAALKMLRKRGRRKGALNNHPLPWWQAVRLANRVGAILTPELKSPSFARPDIARHMVAVARNNDYPLWPMTLLWMRDAKQKVAAFREAGADIAIIFGVRRHLARGRNKIAGWPYKPTRIWGPKSARKWL